MDTTNDNEIEKWRNYRSIYEWQYTRMCDSVQLNSMRNLNLIAGLLNDNWSEFMFHSHRVCAFNAAAIASRALSCCIRAFFISFELDTSAVMLSQCLRPLWRRRCIVSSGFNRFNSSFNRTISFWHTSQRFKLLIEFTVLRSMRCGSCMHQCRTQFICAQLSFQC